MFLIYFLNIINLWLNFGYEILWFLDLRDKFKIRSHDPIFYEVVNLVHVMHEALEWYIGCIFPRLRIFAFDVYT